MGNVKPKIGDFKGLKVHFLQEVESAWTEALKSLGISSPKIEVWKDSISQEDFNQRCEKQPDANDRIIYLPSCAPDKIKEIIQSKNPAQSVIALIQKASQSNTSSNKEVSSVKPTKRRLSSTTTKTSTESKKDWKERLQDLKLFEDTNLTQIEQKINELEGDVNQIIDELQKTITFEKIKDTKLGTKLGRDLSEDDVDMLLITYDEDVSDVSELVNLSSSQKRTKVTQLIKELPDTQEYKLAVEQRVASIKNKVIDAVKSGIKRKVDETIKECIKQNDRSVQAISDKLAENEFYQEEAARIKEAQLEREIRDIRKKRSRKRTAAISAVTQAAISAVVDGCIIDTKRNILAQYDNAVEVAKVANKQLIEAGKNPDTVKDDYKELTETVLQQLKKDRYRLSEIQAGTDTVREKEAASRRASRNFTNEAARAGLEVSNQESTSVVDA